MISLSNTTAQTLQPGQSITFDKVNFHTGCGECRGRSTNSVKLRYNGVYVASFRANITNSVAGAIQLSMQIGGETIPESTMIVTPSTVGNVNNVSETVPIANCCGDYDRISITNTGTTSVVVGANSLLFISRRS